MANGTTAEEATSQGTGAREFDDIESVQGLAVNASRDAQPIVEAVCIVARELRLVRIAIDRRNETEAPPAAGDVTGLARAWAAAERACLEAHAALRTVREGSHWGGCSSCHLIFCGHEGRRPEDAPAEVVAAFDAYVVAERAERAAKEALLRAVSP